MVPQLIGIHKLAQLLDCSTASIYSHIARKNWDAIPIPIRMGKRLAWLQTTVDEWFSHKTNQAVEASQNLFEEKQHSKGRPTKVDTVKRRRKGYASK